MHTQISYRYFQPYNSHIFIIILQLKFLCSVPIWIEKGLLYLPMTDESKEYFYFCVFTDVMNFATLFI